MHLESFVSDTLELTDILRKRCDKGNIFLWGHSWGSGLGFETFLVNAEAYHACIASAVRPDWDSTNEMGYEKVLEVAARRVMPKPPSPWRRSSPLTAETSSTCSGYDHATDFPVFTIPVHFL